QRMLRRARGLITAAVEPPGRAEDFPARRDVRRDDAVTPPEALRLVQVLDDRDLAEQMMNQARRGGAHAPGDPANTVVARDGVGRRRQMLERKERRRPELDTGIGELRLGLGQSALRGGFLSFEPLALLLQRDELGRGPIARGGESPPLSGEALGLSLRLGELGAQPLGAATQLDLTLA